MHDCTSTRQQKPPDWVGVKVLRPVCALRRASTARLVRRRPFLSRPAGAAEPASVPSVGGTCRTRLPTATSVARLRRDQRSARTLLTRSSSSCRIYLRPSGRDKGSRGQGSVASAAHGVVERGGAAPSRGATE